MRRKCEAVKQLKAKKFNAQFGGFQYKNDKIFL